MKKLLFITPILFFTFTTTTKAHPGNTSSDGCHFCRTNCEKWGYTYNTRHGHSGQTCNPSLGPIDPLYAPRDTTPTTPKQPTTPTPTKTPTPTLPTSTPTPTPQSISTSATTPPPKTNTDLIPESKQHDEQISEAVETIEGQTKKPGFWAKLFSRQTKRETTLLKEFFNWLLKTQ